MPDAATPTASAEHPAQQVETSAASPRPTQESTSEPTDQATQATSGSAASPPQLPPDAPRPPLNAAAPVVPDDGIPTATVRRRRRPLSRLASRQGPPPILEPVLRQLRASHPKADMAPVQRAYEIAAKAHAGQKRRSGDPYITHPVAVAGILADLGMDVPTICAALLHDTVEDTDVTIDTLNDDFGELVSLIVDGVTKLDKVKVGDAGAA